MLTLTQMKCVIIGSAEALPILCVRYFRWERERDTERERRKWRHHCRAKIGDEFTLSLAKNSHNWRWAYTFPCQKFALFVSPFTLPVSPFTERSPLWRWNSQWVHAFHCQNFFRPLCSPSFKWHEPRDEWSKTQDKWSNPAQSYYRKRGSASYIVREVLLVRERERYREREREREREIDGSDVTIVALKLAMNLHFPLPKIRTFRFSLHTSRHHGGAEIRNEFTLSIAKIFSPSLFPLFQMARAARRVIENPRQMIKFCPVPFCSSHRKTESN